MIVRDEYKCTGCGDEKSCFVFDEFVLPIALCMECYVRMKQEKAAQEPFEGACLLCDTRKDDCVRLDAKNSILLRGLQACITCFDKLGRKIEEGRYF